MLARLELATGRAACRMVDASDLTDLSHAAHLAPVAPRRPQARWWIRLAAGLLNIAVLLGAVLLCASAQAAGPAGHAHNDYEHDRPLFDALEHGFASVEADIWLRDGALLVGHDLADLDPARTLDGLYLAPLREAAQSGELPGTPPFILLIDIKSEAEATYRALSAELAEYADVLARVENGDVAAGPVTAIVSGNRPKAMMAADDPRYAFYDGRLSDLESGLPPSFMPLVSDNWTRHFGWRGQGEMPADERRRPDGIVTEAHARGYLLRFWETPDRPGPERQAVWQALTQAGVDLINTDDLAGFEALPR